MDEMVPSSSDPFAGIREKLNRSKEGIRRLEVEVQAFLNGSEYPTPQADHLLAEAIDRQLNRPIPLRFSVLAGEIIHHLRSCLDHIVWYFSDEQYKQKFCKKIGFPIFRERPSAAQEESHYRLKIRGVRDPHVLKLIEELQPYNFAGPSDSALLAIHELDIVDKHRTLPLVRPSTAIKIDLPLLRSLIAQANGKIDDVEMVIENNADLLGQKIQLVPEIVFEDLPEGRQGSVIQMLYMMHNEVFAVVETFAEHARPRKF
jgi:hypothetical protein